MNGYMIYICIHNTLSFKLVLRSEENELEMALESIGNNLLDKYVFDIG